MPLYFKSWLAGFIIAGLYLWASTDEYELEIRERILYCKAVGDGTYPDYKHTYENECEKPIYFKIEDAEK